MMLGVTELAVAALLVLVAALVLRLRQHEPAAVERLGRRLDEARDELAAADARIAALREELAQGDETLAPLRSRREALEREIADRQAEAERAAGQLARLRTELDQRRGELDAAAQELAEQRALRAEAEAALREAHERARVAPIAAPAAAPAAPPAGPHPSDVAADRPVRGRVDVAALLAAQDRAARGDEGPTVVATGGAVRPSEALPQDGTDEDTGAAGQGRHP